jgi:uncharacterized Zn finger protein
MKERQATCPECGAHQHEMEGLVVKDITTPDDTNLGLKRFALRCEACGFATAFIGREQ